MLCTDRETGKLSHVTVSWLPKHSKGRDDKARPSKARQGKARQGKARQGKAKQGKAREGKGRQGGLSRARKARKARPC